MTLPKHAGLLALCVALFVAGRCSKPATAPKLEPRVILPDSAIKAPTPPKTLGEKLTQHTVKPAQIATSDGAPGRTLVLDYCKPALNAPAFGAAGFRLSRNSDTAHPLTPVSVDSSRPVLPPFSGRFHAKRLELHTVRSDGSLYRATFDHVRLPASWGSDADSVWLTQERFWVRFGRSAATCGKRAAVFGTLGAIAGGVLAHDAKAGAIIGGASGCGSSLLD